MPTVIRSTRLEINSSDEVAIARRVAQEWATQLGFGTLDRTKLVTAASEIARNTLVHGKGGSMTIAEIELDGRSGLELVFQDQGPGIPDIERALTDGFSTAKSMGLGLGGTRRLVHEFDIVSEPGKGCRVRLVQWKRR